MDSICRNSPVFLFFAKDMGSANLTNEHMVSPPLSLFQTLVIRPRSRKLNLFSSRTPWSASTDIESSFRLLIKATANRTTCRYLRCNSGSNRLADQEVAVECLMTVQPRSHRNPRCCIDPTPSAIRSGPRAVLILVLGDNEFSHTPH